MQYLKSYQEKKVKFRISPNFFFFFEKNIETETQQEHAFGKGNNIESQHVR